MVCERWFGNMTGDFLLHEVQVITDLSFRSRNAASNIACGYFFPIHPLRPPAYPNLRLYLTREAAPLSSLAHYVQPVPIKSNLILQKVLHLLTADK